MPETTMTVETITHATLLELVEAAAVRGARVEAIPGGWKIIFQYGKIERVLAAQRSGQVRVFRKLETLVEYLRKLELTRFEVVCADYDPDGGSPRKRPDRSAAMTAANKTIKKKSAKIT